VIAATADLFSDEVLDQALRHFGVSRSGLRSHEGFCSHVYEGSAGSERVILKLSHSSRIQRAALDSELQFVAHLHRSGVPVCEPLTAPGEVLEIPDQESGVFFAYLYRSVEGEEYEKERRTPQDFESAGRALGLLHLAASRFEYRSHPARLSYLDREFLDFERILPPEEQDTRRCFRGIVDELRALPVSDETYGMTHGDAHDGNLLLSHGEAVWIDFDDVEPGFFLNDVAVFVDSVCDREGCEEPEWVDTVFTSFLRGYSEHQQVPSEWWRHMPLFMKFRWIMNHCVFQMLRGHLVDSDPKLRARRDRRIEMYRSNFARYDYLYGFDFEKAASEQGG
jgi:Ser/Thr protein kinase RdoA (MazF antagonist)